MATKKKTQQTRKTPKSTTPRMYGDGTPAQPAAAPATTSTRAVAATTAGGRPVTTGGRGYISMAEQYAYVMGDLRRLLITAIALFAFLIALGFILR